MKIIDLLNKIANGKIDRNSKYQFSQDDYCTINDFFARYIIDEENLNLEIQEEEKKIPEKLDIELNSGDENKVDYYRATNLECELAFKINSIIDYLKSKGE